MRAPGAPLVFVVAAAAALAAGAPPASADVSVTVGNRQRIDGNVAHGETIRIVFPLARGSVPALTLHLLGAAKNRPISFQTITILAPDGRKFGTAPGTGITAEEAAAFSKHVRQRHVTGRDTFRLSGWTAEAGGDHVLLLETNATIDTTAEGRLTVKRKEVVRFRGDETTAAVVVPLQVDDTTTVVVKRLSGTAPRVDEFVPPGSTGQTPQQAVTKRGAETYPLYASQFGDHEFRIGYQDVPAAGRFKGAVRLTPFRGYGTAAFLLTNDPGVPLTVRNVDRFLLVSWGGPGVGVSSLGDGFVLVTSESAGQVLGQRYTLDLDPITYPLAEFSPVMLADSNDVAPGETVSGHRILATGGNHFLGISTTTGRSLVLKKVQSNRTIAGSARIVENSTDPTHDFFLATDGIHVSVGRFVPPDGHVVHLVDVGTMTPSMTTYPIGGVAGPHVQGAGAAWRMADGLFEFWAPSSLDPLGDSDLHFLRFDATWSLASADQTPVDEVGVNEYLPTAVSVDDASGAMVVHYVVPEYPYEEGAIHRRVVDATGLEIPDSHVVLPGARRSRPTSFIEGNHLFLASEGPNGPTVERYRLLR